MIKIGFIDYFLDEWHANNYPKWIEDNCKKNNREIKLCYAYGEIPSKNSKMTSSEWCEKFGVTECKSIKELCEKSDRIVILSPDNSENHLRYAQEVLPFKKTTYIDKSFTPNLAEAKEIFELAKKYDCKVCSSSALRFASELENYGEVDNIISIGGGLDFDIYAIHQIEMVVKLIKSAPIRIMATQNTKCVNLVIEFENGKKATICQGEYCYDIPFILMTERLSEPETKKIEIKSEFFLEFIDKLLNYFENGKVLATTSETLAVISILDAGKKALKNLYAWVAVEK